MQDQIVCKQKHLQIGQQEIVQLHRMSQGDTHCTGEDQTQAQQQFVEM